MIDGSRLAETLAAIGKELNKRQLVWFGIRGEDALSLLKIPEFAMCFSIIAPLQSGSLTGVAFEEISGFRPDLDLYDIDLDTSEHASEFKRRFLREASSRCVVATYRPAPFISALAFSMSETMTLAGLYKDRQAAFEHKPWVETSLSRLGVKTLGWRYVADEHHSRAKRLLRDGPLVLRASRSSGGVGMARVDTEDEIDAFWPNEADAFVGVAPYLSGAVPLNLSGCVFSDGTVRLHPASMQLIGISSCTARPFGYCGNDFGAIEAIGREAIDEFDALGRTVGRWLHSERYLGAFGVDALLHDGKVLFTEVNARFQGSSALSAEIAEGMGEPDLFMDHLAACLGMRPGDSGVTLSDWVAHQSPLSHVVVHNTSGRAVARPKHAQFRTVGRDMRITQVPSLGLRLDPGAAIFRLVLNRSTTSTGFEIDEASAEAARAIASQFSGEFVAGMTGNHA